MKTLRRYAAAACVLLACSTAPAPCDGPEARVRATLGSTDDVWVGQKLLLVVELLAPGYFASSPLFDLPRLPGVVILPPTDRPVLSTETEDGVSYTVQRHELAIFARRAGGFDIPPFTVRFDFTPSAAGGGAVSQAVTTQALRFIAKLPPGAEKLGSLVSARSLTAEEGWQPEAAKAKTGVAFTRTITFAAPDVPGMAFPPFVASPIDGLGVYAKDPEVLDRSERGVLQGRRRETIIYVCERPGHFVIPAAHFTWWNLEEQRLETVDFPERALDVVANPALAAVSAAGRHARETNLRGGFLVTATLLVVAAVLVFAFRRLWWRAVAYFGAVHLVPLNPQGVSMGGAGSRRRKPIE
jgi:hypothetical protein